MKKLLIILLAVITFAGCDLFEKEDLSLVKVSYDKNEIRLYTAPLAYEVLRDGKILVAKTAIGMKFDGVCCKDALIQRVTTKKLSGTVQTPIYKKASVSLNGVEKFADFGDFGIRLIARADGVAYRFETKKAVTVDNEMAGLTIPPTAQKCWYNNNIVKAAGSEESFAKGSSIEAFQLADDRMLNLPFVYSVDKQVIAVTDADVRDYPVWNLTKLQRTEGGILFNSIFAKYPKTTNAKDWQVGKPVANPERQLPIQSFEDYLVKAPRARVFPWRAFILADASTNLCENDLVYALAPEKCLCSDFEWVKPGKVAWDWWNAFDNKGDPEGCTTETYKRFIDFASKNGVEYVIFDEGWSEKLNIWKDNPNVDVPGLIKYGQEKNVGIILWMAWAQAYGNEEKVASHFAKMGAKGFKVDFMDRGDADLAAFLEKFAIECAKNKMLVDYHGVYRPTGMHRTYPNIINYEGIHGLEQLKWGAKDNKMPDNDVMCFFLRMTAGPMDYTPGAMDNYKVGEYAGNWKSPGSVGTRAHQMALMALYEAPLQMLCDAPTKYEKNMECFSFMAKTPTVWNQTIGLPGCPDSVAAVARQAKDGSWYVAVITNCDAREYELSFAFLGDGEWKAEIFRDAEKSDAPATAYVHENKTFKASDKVKYPLAPGGGFIIHLTK